MSVIISTHISVRDLLSGVIITSIITNHYLLYYILLYVICHLALTLFTTPAKSDICVFNNYMIFIIAMTNHNILRHL